MSPSPTCNNTSFGARRRRLLERRSIGRRQRKRSGFRCMLGEFLHGQWSNLIRDVPKSCAHAPVNGSRTTINSNCWTLLVHDACEMNISHTHTRIFPIAQPIMCDDVALGRHHGHTWTSRHRCGARRSAGPRVMGSGSSRVGSRSRALRSYVEGRKVASVMEGAHHSTVVLAVPVCGMMGVPASGLTCLQRGRNNSS